MIENYKLYLTALQARLDKYFQEASPYVFCKKGCSDCCESGEFPFTNLEFEYMMTAMRGLQENIKIEINKNIQRIKTEKSLFEGEIFNYKCPFLIDNICAVYEHRGLICRTHGLAFFLDGKFKLPHCVNNARNYSNVVDENKTVSEEKFAKLKEKTPSLNEPVAYDVSLKSIIKNDITSYLELEFGKSMPLIDWLD